MICQKIAAGVSDNKRKIFSRTQKAKVALEAIKGLKTINQIAQEYNVHPALVNQWKELLANAGISLKPSAALKRLMRRVILIDFTPKVVRSIWRWIGSKKV